MKLLVDTFNLYARGRFAMQDLSHEGLPTGGLWGSVRTVTGVARSFGVEPKDVWLCMEGGGSILRKEIAPDYKGGRRKESLWHDGDMERLCDWATHFGAHFGYAPYCEADDMIAHFALDLKERAIILSRDHDFFQYLRPGINHGEVFMADSPKNVYMSYDMFVNRFDYEPHHHHLLGYLMGDPSDNVQAAFPRCGKGTALKIARESGWSLEAILQHPKVKPHRNAVILNQALIDPLEVTSLVMNEPQPDLDELVDWYERYGMKSMVREMSSKYA